MLYQFTLSASCGRGRLFLPRVFVHSAQPTFDLKKQAFADRCFEDVLRKSGRRVGWIESACFHIACFGSACLQPARQFLPRHTACRQAGNVRKTPCNRQLPVTLEAGTDGFDLTLYTTVTVYRERMKINGKTQSQ